MIYQIHHIDHEVHDLKCCSHEQDTIECIKLILQKLSPRILVLIRGLPGVGKSHMAYRMNAYFDDLAICEADRYMVNACQEYEYRPERLGECHAHCLVDAVQAMTNTDKKVVVVANTFVRLWEMVPYNIFARMTKRSVVMISILNDMSLNLLSRNVHNVPLDVLSRMAQDWEPYNEENWRKWLPLN